MKIDLTALLGLKKLDPAFAVAEAINDNKELVLTANDRQLDKGKDTEDKDLGEYKNFKYKNRFKPVDLKLTGEFRNNEDVITDNYEMIFIDNDPKTDSLMSRYGKDIIGLPPIEFNWVSQELKPHVINQLLRQINR